ncbi:hypothetical protein A4X03_0g8804 [Tilletia caries]|uniref:Uncharacterized protein n=1 Tax=Tilletia caries TaxID=13290 RepID=A0A8T8SEU6_9BASI|nr:hypothetical protein A4X03_0g8804 [Tilletia caries]
MEIAAFILTKRIKNSCFAAVIRMTIHPLPSLNAWMLSATRTITAGPSTNGSRVAATGNASSARWSAATSAAQQ